MDNTELFDTIGALYDCVTEPDCWPGALRRITEVTDSVISMLAVMDISKKTARFSAIHGDPVLLEPLITTYAAHVPFYSILPRFEIDVPLDFDALCSLYGPDGYDVWRASRTYREWMQPNRLRTGFNLAVMKRDEFVGALTTITRDDTPSTPASMARLSQLAPHIRRAVVIADLFEAEQRKAGIFREVIDNLAHPVLVVTDAMRLLHANPSAEALLRDDTLIRQSEGRLAIAYAPAQASVAHAVELGHRDEVLLGAVGIGVPLVRAERPSILHVLPLSRRPNVGLSRQATAAIFIAAPGTNPLPALEAIAALFGLTAAEKRVAALAAEGRTRSEIAQSNGVSEHTVKTQLGVVYDKTGTRDQRQLQLLMRELTPPIRLDRSDEV
ncbi:MAG: helix-turn-helix transcriptional regulator [Rhodospirillales bacterium]|nr:helix-turn-helix transcriptional regulator [Rhodospirillales bacterium]